MLINYGFTFKTTEFETDSEKAKRIIEKNKGVFSRAEYKDDGFVFYKEHYECPLCHRQYRANELSAAIPIKHSEEEINAFLSHQSESENSSFKLTEITLGGKNNVRCPHCMMGFPLTDDKREIRMSVENGEAVVKVQLKSFMELIDCLMRVSNDASVSVFGEFLASTWEVFSLRGDRAFLGYENETDGISFEKDITECTMQDRNGICLSVLSQNDGIRQFLADYLAPFWRDGFPYEPSELDLNSVITLNRYKGFGKSFYAGVPYKLRTKIIEGSFSSFRNSDEAIEAFEKSTLPKSKTVKKCIIANQSLFFYLPELESLYSALDNPSIFNELLKWNGIYIVLHYLHTYPQISCFFSDFCKSGRTRKLADYLTLSPASICEIAKEYICLGEHYKKFERENGFKGFFSSARDRDYAFERYSPSRYMQYSTPMTIPENDLEDTVLNYDFKFLRNTNDARYAGDALDNCLTEWTCMNGLVMVMRKGADIVAAIELTSSLTCVDDARLANNVDIDMDEDVCKAFEVWCRKHRLAYYMRDEFRRAVADAFALDEAVA